MCLKKPYLLEAKLHSDILEILFKHKKEIFLHLSDIRGMYYIDHICINIVNVNNEIIIFSITPSVEYNVIVEGLWKYDKSFQPTSNENGSFYFWDQGYANDYGKIIKHIKEEKHGYTKGFYLAREIEELNMTYSFATRSKEKNLDQYYAGLKKELFVIGDYGFKKIRDLFRAHYNVAKNPIPDNRPINYERKHLKLIVNNDR